MSDRAPVFSEADSPRWQAADASLLDWSCLDPGRPDDDCVVFHRPSGKTHLVNGPTVRLLLHVLVEPRSLDEILDESADDELREHTAGLLLRLEELGLVSAQ